MDYIVSADVAHRFVRVTWQADVTAQKIRKLWEELGKDPRGLSMYDTLIDLRSARVSVSADDIRGLALLSRNQPASRRAIVTAAEADYGMMRMLEMMTEPGTRELSTRRQFGVFRTIEQACQWLANPGCPGEDRQ